MSVLLADYDAERQAFETLVEKRCQKGILLFHGESGSGKTHLLKYCQEQVPQGMLCIPIQLRGTAVSVAEIFYRSGGLLDWQRLSSFTEQVAGLQGTPKVQIDRNWLAGINNRISVALHAENPMDRQHRRVALTEAWFDDLKALSESVLFMLDTYEQATTEVQEWISGPFLARTARDNQVRVLLAGQTVPDENNIEWGHCCTMRQLFGVSEARHWLPIVQAMERHIPVPDALSWLAGVCHVMKGRPKEIMQVIEGLPPRPEPSS